MEDIFESEKRYFELLKKLAKKGIIEANVELGEAWRHGLGTKKNVAKAVQYYTKAAELGHRDAQYILGTMYIAGDETEPDYGKMIKWYTRAAENGQSDAQLGLGLVYLHGNFAEKNEPEAVRWLRMSAENGNSEAQERLAECCKDGTGMEKDLAEAEMWYRKLIDERTSAMIGLAEICKEQGDLAGAFGFYAMAAEDGDPDAMHAVGDAYKKGRGTPKDDMASKMWYDMEKEIRTKFEEMINVMMSAPEFNEMGMSEDELRMYMIENGAWTILKGDMDMATYEDFDDKEEE